MPNTECIPYINDLYLEIQILKAIKQNDKCDIDNINKQIKEKENILIRCRNNLEKLSNNQIYYKLYLNLLNGLTPSQSVEKVAQDNYLQGIKPSSVSKIWEYYKKMKKMIEISQTGVKRE